jgi:hypothetical protein
MTANTSRQLDEEVQAAEAALRAAQDMPSGSERIAALRKAGQMRFDAYKKMESPDAQ